MSAKSGTEPIVSDLRVLKAMERAGLIRFHKDTGKRLAGLYGGKHKICYVGGYPEDGDIDFEYKGKRYTLRYLSGCFCPFVFDVKAAEKAKMDLRHMTVG